MKLRRNYLCNATLFATLAAAATLTTGTCLAQAPDQSPTRSQIEGWLNWRGPDQTGSSAEVGLPTSLVIGENSKSWRLPLNGRGTPVIANGRVYTLGYRGTGKQLIELLVCLDERNGKVIWEKSFTHFLTDIIYHRFALGSPTIDPDTGNIFVMLSAGQICSFTPDGELRWQHASMSEFGRLVFPNGRTGSISLTDKLAIMHMTSSGWGPQGPARDRFFAFDKQTGECVWTSTPGGPPKDISFSRPLLAWQNGRQIAYAGLSGGHMACVDARTGEALWRFPMCTGGMSSTAVLYKDTLIAIHGKENLDTSTGGRMVAIKLGAEPKPGEKQLVLGKDHEVWRNELTAFTSSPILVGNRVYTTVATGELACVDADTGKILWQHKLAPDQIHASPAYGDGRLWVPMNNGEFFIVKPSDEGMEVVAKAQLDGNCLGAPAICNGRVYVHTTEALYCFAGTGGDAAPKPSTVPPVPTGTAITLQIIPADARVHLGERSSYRVRAKDSRGATVMDLAADGVQWSGKLPKGVTIKNGILDVPADASPGVAVLTATAGGITGTARLRIVPGTSHSDNFEDVALMPHPKEEGVKYGKPRPYWIGANLKWEVRELDGHRVLARTLDRPLFQRTISMIGDPRQSNYTMTVDVRTDGNRRTMSAGGMINQRYAIVLKGNHQQLEISSNEELIKENARFRWKAGIWYRVKSRVDANPDGSGVVRAKAWQRDAPEPEGWLLEVNVPNVNHSGSPGLYGFTPQSRFRVYLDNITITPNR
jgi:outer membrane protein assembly factor BamB